MKTTTTLRRIHVLVMRGELFATSSRHDDSVPADSLLRSHSTLQVTVQTAVRGQAGGVASTAHPDVIVLDGVDGDPAEFVAELDEAASETPVLVVLDENDSDRVQACVVAGARGCLVRPFDDEGLVATILQVHEKASRRRRQHAERGTSAAAGGRLIAVRGTKGGVGATAIATSLAVAIKRRSKDATALVDGHFFGGDVPLALNLVPNRSLVDLIPHLDRLDDDLLGATLAQHSSGVSVLAAPAEFERAESIRSDEYQRVLEALRARYAYVVVDCSPFLDQNSITALDMADTVLLVTTPELAALKNAARLIQLGARLGYSEQKMRLLVNRFNVSGALARSDFEHHLEYRTSFRIPNDDAVARALTRGEPLVTFQASCSAARALDRLARTIIGDEGWEGEPHRGGRGLLRLAHWRPFARGERPTPRTLLEAA
jgi:pilus assembly protein CpaE